MRKFIYILVVSGFAMMPVSAVNADTAKNSSAPVTFKTKPNVVINALDASAVSAIEPAAGGNTVVVIETQPKAFDAITGEPVKNGPVLENTREPSLRDKIRNKMN